MGRKLDDNEQAELLKGGYNQAVEFLKPKFPFPDADVDFNLKALGQDPNPVKEALRSSSAWFDLNYLELVNGKVIITDKGRELVDESSCRFTQNEKQNEAYKLAVDLCKQINRSCEAGHIGPLDRPTVERGIRSVKWNGKEFYPNPSFIQLLNENGEIMGGY